ncbi:MAG: hypothetical protein EOO41_02780 [Methanobacteriota archaeon]|nr:MAG: hypothetical protein EOO41_02780 [Euryarchaeota archaeon]
MDATEAVPSCTPATSPPAGGGAAPPPPPPPAGGEVAGVQDGTASVASTLISGMETPDVVQLRKGTQAPAMEPYRVLQEKRVGTTTGSLALTSHAYIIPPAGGSGAAGGSGGVEVALQPEELAGLDERKLLEKYEQQVAATEASARAAREDVASVLEEQDRKRKRKEAGLSMAEGSKAKRAKDFKF